MNASVVPPALWDTTADASAFDPEDWLAWCARRTGAPVPRLPEAAVVSVVPGHERQAAARLGSEPRALTQAGHRFTVGAADGLPVTVVQCPKGSYVAGVVEELVALGARRVVLLGHVGALGPELAPHALVVATRALRDEGVSHHYLPPGRWAEAAPTLTAALHAVAPDALLGPVWTSAAHFRETRSRIAAFRAEGCVAVGNEAASAFAVGAFRRVAVGALQLVGDTLVDGRIVLPDPAADAEAADARLLGLALLALARSRPGGEG